ncbi:MAG: FMN-binding protein [Desulfobacterales bacterium]
MSDTLKSIVFAAVLCLTCSVLLTAASSGLKGIQQQNIALDKQKNILKSVGLVDEKTPLAAKELQALYSASIKPLWVDSKGLIVSDAQGESAYLPVYLYMKEDEIAAYVIPFNSRGLWGEIEGYVAIDNDGSTVSGFTVYSHSETPGLGGEIEKRWFQKNFVGKKIVNRRGEFVSIGIGKRAVSGAVAEAGRLNHVDGISGATLTGRYLSSGLRDVLARYEPMSLRLRNNRLKPGS